MDKNTNVQIENNITDKRKDIFLIIVTAILSIIILILLVGFLMINSKVNQGKFRVSDAIITSKAVLEDTREITSKWTFNVSQTNTLSLLVVPSETDFKAVITDIVATKDGIQIYQVGNEENIVAAGAEDILELNTSINESSFIIYELNITNPNVLKNFEIPEGTNEIIHDATIFKRAGLTKKDLEFTIAFKLVLTDSLGKESVMNINLKLPKGDILNEGSSVTRQNLSQFVFKVK